MLLARIVQSTSHVDYAARVLDSLETATPPSAADYHFGQFVRIPAGSSEAVGVVYNSQLINPEFGSYGPRLTTPTELNAVFSPDYLNEQGVLIAILLLGWHEAGDYRQGIPRAVLPVNSPVEMMPPAEVAAFHRDQAGKLRLAYYTQVASHARLFAFHLIDAIIDQLNSLVTPAEQARLRVLRQGLAWRQTLE